MSRAAQLASMGCCMRRAAGALSPIAGTTVLLTMALTCAGEEGEARSPDLGHILAGSQNRQPAPEAAASGQKRPPPLEHTPEEPSTPQKPSAEGESPVYAAYSYIYPHN